MAKGGIPEFKPEFVVIGFLLFLIMTLILHIWSLKSEVSSIRNDLRDVVSVLHEISGNLSRKQ